MFCKNYGYSAQRNNRRNFELERMKRLRNPNFNLENTGIEKVIKGIGCFSVIFVLLAILLLVVIVNLSIHGAKEVKENGLKSTIERVWNGPENATNSIETVGSNKND